MADWVTVTAYLFAAWVSARAARQAVLRSAARDSLFWRIAAVLLVLLGLDELLDAQSCLHPSATRMRRHMAGMESTGGCNTSSCWDWERRQDAPALRCCGSLDGRRQCVSPLPG
jgi:hypothetical protein